MFAVRETKKGAPARLVRDPALQPEFVDAVAGTIAIASHDPIQTEKDLLRLPEVLHCFCEADRALSAEANQRAIRPLGRRPISCRIKCCLVARICQRAAKPFQITLGAASPGESASNKTNLHEVSEAPCAERANRESKLLGFRSTAK